LGLYLAKRLDLAKNYMALVGSPADLEVGDTAGQFLAHHAPAMPPGLLLIFLHFFAFSSCTPGWLCYK
jgi:hypothetical protein